MTCKRIASHGKTSTWKQEVKKPYIPWHLKFVPCTTPPWHVQTCLLDLKWEFSTTMTWKTYCIYHTAVSANFEAECPGGWPRWSCKSFCPRSKVAKDLPGRNAQHMWPKVPKQNVVEKRSTKQNQKACQSDPTFAKQTFQTNHSRKKSPASANHPCPVPGG